METRKIKIGIFVDAYFPMIDGVIIVVDNYARKLLNYGDVTVFCPQARDRRYIDDVPYKVVRSQKIRIPLTDYDYSLPFIDVRFNKALRHSNLDIIHIHSPFSLGKIGVSYAKKHKIPCISTLHSQFKMDFEQRVKNEKIADAMIKEIMKVFNQCDEMYTVNPQVARIFKSYGALSEPKIRGNGTDLVPLPDDESLHKIRQEFGIKYQEKILLFVGEIDAIKNIFFIVESLKTVKLARLPFRMFFVGSGPDEDKLKEAIKDAKLSQQITMVGRITDRVRLSRFYQLSDLFIFPSLYDANSLVQIEAASQRTPSLFLRGAATADLVIDKVNGFLAENDPVSYGNTMVSILQDTQLLKEVSEHAFRDLYRTWDEQVDKTYETYQYWIAKYRK